MTMNLVDMAERVAQFCNASHIDSINDSDESLRIAQIIKETYETMVLSQEIQTALELFKLQSASNSSLKTTLYLPEDCLTLDIVKYTSHQNKIYSPQYLEPMDFISRSLDLDVTRPEVETVVDPESATTYNILNNKDHKYYTQTAYQQIYTSSSFNITSLTNSFQMVFDSYNKDFEDVLQGRHALVYGHTLPEFKLEDDFVPDLQEQQFPVLLSKAKTAADMELRNNFNQVEADRGKKLFLNMTNDSKSYTRRSTTWNNRNLFRV